MKPESYFWRIESLWQNAWKPLIIRPSADEFFCVPFCEHVQWERSQDVVFYDEHHQGYYGLQKSFWTIAHGKPVFITDNHQNVLSAFYDFFLQENNHPITVVHIDAHRDDAKFPFEISAKDDVKTIEKKCRVSDYLDAGKKLGIIQEVISCTQSSEFENPFPLSPFLLNLDIDIFGKEGECVDLETKIKKIAESWKQANAVCIATSPGFIDEEEAFRIIDILIKPFEENFLYGHHQ